MLAAQGGGAVGAFVYHQKYRQQAMIVARGQQTIVPDGSRSFRRKTDLGKLSPGQDRTALDSGG